MNKQAERHLGRAEGFLARGDELYGKAADEIIAAQKADPQLTQREIGEWFGKSRSWVSKVVTWRTNGSPENAPIDWGRGSHSTTAEIDKGVKQVLRDPEARRALVESLTDEERHELVDDALEVTMKPLHQEAATRRAVREEHLDDPRATSRAKAKLAAAKAILSLRQFASIARDERWTKREENTLLSVLDKVADALETARLATSDAESVDWDDELARLNKTAEAMEGGV